MGRQQVFHVTKKDFSGVMQDYYLRERVFNEPHAEMQLTFVGTLLQVIAVAFIFLGNIMYSFLGFRLLLIIGTTMSTLGMILAGQATSVGVVSWIINNFQ